MIMGTRKRVRACMLRTASLLTVIRGPYVTLKSTGYTLAFEKP